MRIRGQTAAPHLLAKTLQLTLVEAALEIGARVDTRCGMTLHEHHVAGMSGAACAPEMIESHLVKRSCRGVARDVPAVLGAGAVRLYHHRERVPAHVGLVAQLERAVARVVGLLGPRDRIEIRGIRLEGKKTPGPAGETHPPP